MCLNQPLKKCLLKGCVFWLVRCILMLRKKLHIILIRCQNWCLSAYLECAMFCGKALKSRLSRLVKAGYYHDHEEAKPKGMLALARHVLQRLYYHQNDALLYKKHPNKVCEEFLHIKYGFLVDPAQDFRVATGLWKKGGKLEAGSPRGITFIENRGPAHAAAIVAAGIAYVMLVKASRLMGSVRFGKLVA